METFARRAGRQGHGMMAGYLVQSGRSQRQAGHAPQGGRRHGKGPQALASLLPKVTRKAFERFGFPAASLLTDWEAIAGCELAAYTQPERLRWPKRATEGVQAPGDASGRKPSTGGHGALARDGATLVLRVDGARALEVQHRAGQIIDRINAFFGYRAVTELRILQAPVSVNPLGAARALRPRKERIAPPGMAEADLSFVRNRELRQALERLRRGMQAGRPA